MERPTTVRVLAAPGLLIRHRTASGAAALRNHSDPEEGELQAAVYISDAGLWDGKTRKVFAPGPVEIVNDRHTRSEERRVGKECTG